MWSLIKVYVNNRLIKRNKVVIILIKKKDKRNKVVIITTGCVKKKIMKKVTSVDALPSLKRRLFTDTEKVV